MKNKYLLYVIAIFLCFLVIGITYSSWVYVEDVTVESDVTLVVTEWEFTPLNNASLVVDENGGAVIIDEEGNETPVEVTVNNDGSVNYADEDISVTITQDDEGNLVVTEFTAETGGFVTFFTGSSVYLPTSITIGDNTYPVTGIAEPLSISFGWSLGGKHVYIPEGYTYICDNAFEQITDSVTFHMPSTMQYIGHGAFNPSWLRTQTIQFAGTQAQWQNNVVVESDYNKGSGSVSISYQNN